MAVIVTMTVDLTLVVGGDLVVTVTVTVAQAVVGIDTGRACPWSRLRGCL